MIRYRKYQSKTKGPTLGKWYARTAPVETVDLDGLAKHMSQHNTPYSQGCIRGVLHDMADCIKELLLEGKNVKIPNLVIFSVRMTSTGATTAKEFSVANNIKAFTLNARATGQLRPSTMKASGEIRAVEATEYSVGDTDNGAGTGPGGGGSGNTGTPDVDDNAD